MEVQASQLPEVGSPCGCGPRFWWDDAQGRVVLPHFLGGLVETQSARRSTVALSSGESSFYALNIGCAAGALVVSCTKGMQSHRLPEEQRDGLEWSDSNSWIRDT